jgi:hypothetical protein
MNRIRAIHPFFALEDQNAPLECLPNQSDIARPVRTAQKIPSSNKWTAGFLEETNG